MTPLDHHVDLFNDSLERCRQDSDFLKRFYDTFIGSSPEVQEKFNKTDMSRQVRMLEASLYLIVSATRHDGGAEASLSKIAERHSRGGLQVRPGLYDLWMECLIDTARGVDPMFDEEIEVSWRQVLSYGVEFMKSRY